jgi:hypothetical protein
MVNSYFRSGSTFIWSFIKDSLSKGDYISLYEPLNPHLAVFLRKEKAEPSINKLHKKVLFKDYLNLDDETILKIIRNNPNSNPHGIHNDFALLNFLNIIHDLPYKVFIQTNRLHFHLDLVFQNYTNKVIHLIRNPLDVWLSIRKAATVFHGSKVKQHFQRLFLPINLINAFEIDKQYHWIINQAGYPFDFSGTMSTRVFNHFNAFEKFVVVWTISNYHAMKFCDSEGMELLIYEDILEYPDQALEKMRFVLDIELWNKFSVIKGNRYKINQSLKDKFLVAINKYKLNPEFEYIIHHNMIKDMWKMN